MLRWPACGRRRPCCARLAAAPELAASGVNSQFKLAMAEPVSLRLGGQPGLPLSACAVGCTVPVTVCEHHPCVRTLCMFYTPA